MMAYAVQSAYGSVSAKIESATCRWTPAEVRNETEVIDNALKLADYIDECTLLEEIATVKGWDAEKIDLILSSKRGDSAARLAALGGGLGTMNGLPEDDDELDLQDLNIDNLALTEA